MKIAIVGITGLVGNKMKEILDSSNLPIDELIPIASEKNIGKEIIFRRKTYSIIGIDDIVKYKPNIALLSAGSSLSYNITPKLCDNNITVIDNSSAWRMHDNIKLIVPEVNKTTLNKYDKIIANPNCSTIQLVVAIYKLHYYLKIKRIIVSTYQSITGTGKKAIKQFYNERNNIDINKIDMAYNYRIDMNIIPHIDMFLDNNYSKEEMKIINETKKILNDDKIQITSTAVRVPVIGGHSLSVNIEFENKFDMKYIYEIFNETEGIKLQDDIKNNIYPMPINAYDKDEVLIGRIRKDESCTKAINIWIVADNLRKGAATNAIQILQYIYLNNWI